MKEILIISGKGGTGKTSITGAFAVLAENKVMVDCDVDAADLHLILDSSVQESHEFYGSKLPVIDREKCIQCGKCEEFCRFDAIKNLEVIPYSCEGCEGCYHLCPAGAISLQDRLSGHWFISTTKYGPLVHARLGIAEENSGRLVAEVRKNARSLAESRGLDLIITDGPPGIGCPVVSSLSGVDLVLLIAEPTVSGIHDLERIVSVARHFYVEPIVCINKYNLDIKKAREIEDYCNNEGIEVAGRLSFDPVITRAMVMGKPVVETDPDAELSKQIMNLWHVVMAKLN